MEKRNKRILKRLLSLLLIAGLAYCGMIALFIAAFSGSTFYMVLSVALVILFSFYLILWGFELSGKRPRLIFFLIVLSVSVVSITINELHTAYVRSIPTLGEYEVNLQEYQPFEQNTKAVKLNKPSTLTFNTNDSLPRIDGATALYPLYAAFVQATYPPDEYSVHQSIVRGGTTPTAYERLLNAEVDVIFCAAPSGSQVEMAREAGKEFHMTPIGKEAFVFFVNSTNPVSELTVQQVQDIYSGRLTNWNEVDGKNEYIRAFQRPKNSGSQTMLEKIMAENPIMNPPLDDIVGGMGGIIERTATYKNWGNAIGYTFRFYATGMVQNDKIKLLKINGVYPDRTSIESGTYPFTGDFYAITVDPDNANVQKLIEWIKSPQGIFLIEETGYTAID